MKLVSIAILAVATALAGCGLATRTATGIVVAVDQVTLTEIRSFTLRTEAGEMLTFRVGALDLSSGAFPANHLREHMATAAPIAVAYTDNNGEPTAVRLVDAPSLDP